MRSLVEEGSRVSIDHMYTRYEPCRERKLAGVFCLYYLRGLLQGVGNHSRKCNIRLPLAKGGNIGDPSEEDAFLA